MIRVTFTDDGSTCDLDDDAAVRVEGKPWGLRVWQLRGVDGAMVGGRPVTVETYQEQIARLERERDDETRRAESLLTTLLDVTAQAEDGARRRCALLAQEAAEKARADAAEKRLADLRAWADDIVKRSREEAPKHPGKANTTWTILSVLEWVVERIDGKEG